MSLPDANPEVNKAGGITSIPDTPLTLDEFGKFTMRIIEIVAKARRGHKPETPEWATFSEAWDQAVRAYEAYRITEAALAAANGKLEEVAGLPGKWRVAQERAFLRQHGGECADELEAALASPGPSLWERVAKALATLRLNAEEWEGDSTIGVSCSVAAGIRECADLVQAALEGEVT